MGNYNDSTKYPMSFYDSGGGSYGLVNPNVIQAGTLMGDMNVGTNGPVISPSTGSIFTTGSSPIVINSAGISIGGTIISSSSAVSQTVYNKVLGPFTVSATSGGIYSGDGVTLWQPSLHDIILDIWSYTTVAWSGGSGLGGALFVSINMASLNTNTVSFFNTNCLLSTTVTSITSMTTSVAPYLQESEIPIQWRPALGASPQNVFKLGPIRVIDASKPICARAVAPAGAADQFTLGSTNIYAHVLTNIS